MSKPTLGMFYYNKSGDRTSEALIPSFHLRNCGLARTRPDENGGEAPQMPELPGI